MLHSFIIAHEHIQSNRVCNIHYIFLNDPASQEFVIAAVVVKALYGYKLVLLNYNVCWRYLDQSHSLTSFADVLLFSKQIVHGINDKHFSFIKYDNFTKMISKFSFFLFIYF